MTIVAITDSDNQWQELSSASRDIDWVKASDHFSFAEYAAADAFFILKENMQLDFSATVKPVFINSVSTTLKALQAPQNVVRINGWNSFLQRPTWETAGNISAAHTNIAEKINKKLLPVKDEPGLIAARVIAMIINEAYFALDDEVCTIAAIDTAMKLGTNYPYGPFEWANKIGPNKIFKLLQQLATIDKRYTPSPSLVAATEIN